MKRSAGFSFIELSIALLIASLLSILLYTSFYKTQQTAQVVSSMIDFATVAPTAYNQFEKDITALFVPEAFFKELAEQHNKKPDEKKESKEPLIVQ